MKKRSASEKHFTIHRLTICVLRAGFFAITVMVLGACAGDKSSCLAPHPHGDSKIIEASKLSSMGAMLQWIETIYDFGIRRPGYPADARTMDFIETKFRELGLENITRQPIEFLSWRPMQWDLTVWLKADPKNRMTLRSYPIPYSKPVDKLIADLSLDREDMAGDIWIQDLSLIEMSQASVIDLFAKSYHDPLNTLEGHIQTSPFTWQLFSRDLFNKAVDGGALGLIGILDFPWETDQYYVPYDAITIPIPGLWLSKANGERLKSFMTQGEVTAEISLVAESELEVSYNIHAELPATNKDEWIMLGTHHDGPWQSAVEDASGVAMVLAQAEYWSKVPTEERPHNLFFLVNGAHMAGWPGVLTFIEEHLEWIENDLVASIFMEHVAKEAAVVDGRLVPTEQPVVRWFFSNNQILDSILAESICLEDIRRAMVMPASGFPPGNKRPPTDGGDFAFHAPIANFLSAPKYLFDPADTMEMIDEDGLVPLSRAIIRVVNRLGDHSALSLRASQDAPFQIQQ